MKRVLGMLLCGCALAGCRTVDPSVSMLEAELRWLEDQYYVLEEQYNQKCQQLQACRAAHASNAVARPAGERVPTPAPDDDQPRPESSRRQRDDASEDLRPPNVRFPGDMDLTPPGPPGVTPMAYHGVDARVTHIVLNGKLTGGYDRDGKLGDDGVLVVIEPRNQAGQFVPIAGDVTVRLVDIAAREDDHILAHWRVSASQADSKMRRSLLGRGMYLELPWPVEPPGAEELRLEVIYTSADGRKLGAKRTIMVDLPRSLSARWTPISPHDLHGGAAARHRVDTALRPQRRPASNVPPAPLDAVDAPPPSWAPQR